MDDSERMFLLHRLDETRQVIEEILPTLERTGEIYPGWTIKEMLAHMTGWDDCTIDCLRSHVIDRPPTIPAIRSLDEYNSHTVSSRKDLDFDQVLREWRLTRQVLLAIIQNMPEEKFVQPLAVPWGQEKETVIQLVDIFREHEQQHIHDILEWARHPEQPLGKEGN